VHLHRFYFEFVILALYFLYGSILENSCYSKKSGCKYFGLMVKYNYI